MIVYCRLMVIIPQHFEGQGNPLMTDLMQSQKKRKKEGRSREREEEAGKAGWGQTMQDLVNLRISEFF